MSDNKIDYYNFLMLDLASINEVGFEDPSQIAYEICLLFSINEDTVPESFYKMYISSVNVDRSILINSIAYFSGAGFLSIECDCCAEDQDYCEIHNIQSNEYFLIGSAEKQIQSEQWTSMKSGIERYRDVVFHGNEYDC